MHSCSGVLDRIDPDKQVRSLILPLSPQGLVSLILTAAPCQDIRHVEHKSFPYFQMMGFHGEQKRYV